MGVVIFLIIFVIISLISASARGENTGCLTSLLGIIGIIGGVAIPIGVIMIVTSISENNFILKIILLLIASGICFWFRNKLDD